MVKAGGHRCRPPQKKQAMGGREGGGWRRGRESWWEPALLANPSGRNGAVARQRIPSRGSPQACLSQSLFSCSPCVSRSCFFSLLVSVPLSLARSVAPTLLGRGWVDSEQGLPRHSQCLCVMSLGVELQGGMVGEGVDYQEANQSQHTAGV